MVKPSQLFEQVSIMSLSFFIHFYGEAKHGAALCGDAEARLRNLRTELGTKCSIILHSPLAVSGNDLSRLPRLASALHNSSKLSGTSPNFFKIVASAKLPKLGSPERMNESAPTLAGSRDMASALRLASGAL